MSDAPPDARPLPPPPPDPRSRRRALVRVGLLALAVAGAALYLTLSGGELSAERLRTELEQLGGGGVGGALVLIVASIALSCVNVPAPALAGAAGLIYGTALGTLVAHVAIVLAACVQMLITRYVARERAGALVPERLRRVDDVLERRGFVAVLLYRIIPGLPFVGLNYAAGLTRLRLRDMFLGTLVGKAPRTWAYAALGGHLDDLSSPTAIAAVALLAALAVGGIVLARHQIAVERRTRPRPR